MQVVLDDYVSGASFATDLVNTSPRVWVEAGDALPDSQTLHDLLDEHGLSPDALTNGRGPTRLISPVATFQSCGSSSML